MVKEVTLSGLASQKYTFGVRELATITTDGKTFDAVSQVAKFVVSPLTYKAAVVKQDGVGKLKGNVSGTFITNKLDTLDVAKYVRGYEYVWYDGAKKEYVAMPAGAVFDVGVPGADGVFVGGTFSSLLPSKSGTTKATVGVREVLYDMVDPTKVVAKSALTKVVVNI